MPLTFSTVVLLCMSAHLLVKGASGPQARCVGWGDAWRHPEQRLLLGVAVRRSATLDAFFSTVLVGRGLDHGVKHLAIAFEAIGGELPCLAIPSLHPHPGRAHVVAAVG